MLRATALLLALCGPFLTGAPGSDVGPIERTFDPDTQSFAFVIGQLPVVEGTTGLRASECGQCHQKIYRDWSGSTHAHALSDLQFLAELSKPDSPQWLCLNCHIPIENQREDVVLGLGGGDVMKPVTRPNDAFDRTLQHEGITCAACHVRIDTGTGKSTIIGPNGSGASPHPVRVDRAHLRNVCLRCHDPKGESITPNLVCWFYTSAELAQARAQVRKAFGEEKDCVDCHMPEEDSPVSEAPAGLPAKRLNRHWWNGGGIPKETRLFNNLLEQRYQSGLDVVVSEAAANDGRVRVVVALTNARAGHNVPTGDPERFILTLVTVTGADGKVIARDRRRVGQVWEWNPARKVSDDRIRMGETRVQEFDLQGINADRVARIDVEVLHVKLTSANMRYMMGTQPIVDRFYADTPERVRAMNAHYPTAFVIYYEQFDRNGNRTRLLTREKRIERSRLLVSVPLEERDY